MKVLVRGASLLVVIALVLVGLRLRSLYRLLGEVDLVRASLHDGALGPLRGLESIPGEAEVRAKAAAAAVEHGLEASEIEVTTERDVAPVGAAARIADGLGQVPGPRDVDDTGELRAPPTTTLRTTRVLVRMRVRGDGFLCSVDEVVVAQRQYGFALR